MSTRCNIHFSDGDDIAANVYRHHDGYPEGVLPDMQRFFKLVESDSPHDTRFDDPEYLAAKFIVWQASENSRGPRLAFTGVSPCVADHGDIEHVYNVDCSHFDVDGHPSVTTTPVDRL